MPERIDQQLLRLGLVRSRSQAQVMIAAGCVLVGPRGRQQTVVRAAMRAVADDEIAMTVDAWREPVSRGGRKLAALLERLAPECVRDALCLDAGQSTGGFTECLLANGAAAVIGIEVGHAQLAESLRADPRVVCVEKTHIADCTLAGLAGRAEFAHWPAHVTRLGRGHGFDVVVADLSFISLRQVLPVLATLLRDGGDLLALVKPQFELGPGMVNSRGIVTDHNAREGLQAAFITACTLCKLEPLLWMESPVQGGDGNTEFLLHAQRHETTEKTR